MRKILVVDDEPMIRDLLKGALEDAGYAALEASDGAAALALVEREAPDLVIMDVVMPSLDGREVIRRMRRSGLPPIPVMLVSGALRVRPEGTGAAAFLPKPFDLDHLLDMVARILDRESEPHAPQVPRESPQSAAADRHDVGGVDRSGRWEAAAW